MSYSVEEALSYRTAIIDAVDAAREAMIAGQEFITNLRAEVSEIASAVWALPNVAVGDLGQRATDLADRITRLTNGNLENVVHLATTMDRHLQLITGVLPCEDGVRDFAGDNHEDCYNAEDVVLSVHDSPQEAGYVSMNDLAGWLEKAADTARVSDVLDTAASEASRGTFRYWSLD